MLKAHAEAAATDSIIVKFDIQSAPISSSLEGREPDRRRRQPVASEIAGAHRAGFDGDKSKLTLGEKTKSLLAKTATGKELPYAQLIYVWANKYPVGTVIPNPHTKRVEMVVAVSGADQVGKWVTLSRNVVDDFKRAFGEEPGLMTDVGIPDTDNTGASVDAWWRPHPVSGNAA